MNSEVTLGVGVLLGVAVCVDVGVIVCVGGRVAEAVLLGVWLGLCVGLFSRVDCDPGTGVRVTAAIEALTFPEEST